MTILTVCQNFATTPGIGLKKPTAVLASTEREDQEMATLANRAAKHILEDYDWELLKTLDSTSIVGDGTTTTFSLPSDFNRFVWGGELRSSALAAAYNHVTDTDQWLMQEIQALSSVVNSWTLYGGSIRFNSSSPPASGVTVKFFYISDLIVSPASGSNKTAFTADDDSFRMDEELLTLAMIWRWKEGKGLPYAEAMNDYEIRKGQLIRKNKGPRAIRIGRLRYPTGVTIAYPQTISES